MKFTHAPNKISLSDEMRYLDVDEIFHMGAEGMASPSLPASTYGIPHQPSCSSIEHSPEEVITPKNAFEDGESDLCIDVSLVGKEDQAESIEKMAAAYYAADDAYAASIRQAVVKIRQSLMELRASQGRKRQVPRLTPTNAMEDGEYIDLFAFNSMNNCLIFSTACQMFLL